jgi:hypothetical protein
LSSRLAGNFGTLEQMMSESEPESPAASAPGDPLAAKLLAVQRALAALGTESEGADPEARVRLNNRFMAICTALKMPGASGIRCIRRLNELLAEAEQVRAGNSTSRHKDV